MKVYPGIYRNIREGDKSTPYLFTDESNYFCFGSERWGKITENDNHDTDTNITREYLANTWGEVKSKEHAEFLAELAKSNGLGVWPESFHGWNLNIMKTFIVYNGTLEIHNHNIKGDGRVSSCKQITIPEPPQQNTNTPEEDFEMKQKDMVLNVNNPESYKDMVLNVNSPEGCKAVINKAAANSAKVVIGHVKEIINGGDLKECGDNLIFGAADKCSEWPCVGDEVLVRIDAHEWDVKYGHDVDGMKGIVRSVFKDGNVDVYAVSVEGVCYCFVRGLLRKPKTPEEELRDEIAQDLAASYANITDVVKDKSNFKHYAVDLMSKYNITKK